MASLEGVKVGDVLRHHGYAYCGRHDTLSSKMSPPLDSPVARCHILRAVVEQPGSSIGS